MLAAAGFAHAADPAREPRVELFTGSRLEEIQDSGLREAMRHARMRPAPISQFKEMRAAAEGLADMVRKLIDPKSDPVTHYKLVVLDDLRPLAHMLRPENGVTHIFVSTGAIFASQNDDQLAHFVSHEMEHGASQVHQFVESLSPGHDKRRTAIPMSLSDLYIRSLERAEESEVDVKGMVRMHRAGYNPYEAEKLMATLALKEGDAFSLDHPMLVTRRNALATATTLYTRVMGREADARAPPKTVITKPFNQFVTSRTYLAHRKAELGSLQTAESPQFSNFLRQVRVAKPDSPLFRQMADDAAHLDTVASIATREMADRMDRARALWEGVVPASEQKEYEMKLAHHLVENRTRAFQKIMGPGYQPPNVPAGEVLATYLLDDPSLRVLGGGNYIDIIEQSASRMEILSEIRDEEKKLSSASSQARDAAESRLKTLRAKLASREEAIRAQRRLFRPSQEFDRMLEVAARTVVEHRADAEKPKVALELQEKILAQLKSSYSTLSAGIRSYADSLATHWFSRLDFRLDAIEVGAFHRQIRRLPPEFWQENAVTLLKRLQVNYQQKLSLVPTTAEAAAKRLELLHFASGLYKTILECALKAKVPGIEALLDETARSIHLPFVQAARSTEELAVLMPRASPFDKAPRGLSLEEQNGVRFLSTGTETRKALLRPPFAELYLEKSMGFFEETLRLARSPLRAKSMIENQLASLIELKKWEGVVSEEQLQKALERVTRAVLEDYQARFFSEEGASMAARHARSLINAQFGYDLRSLRPLSEAEKLISMRDLPRFRQISSLQQSLSAVSLDYISGSMPQARFMTVAVENSALIGRGGGFTPISDESVGKFLATARRLVQEDVDQLRLASRLTSGYGSLGLSDSARMAVYEQSKVDQRIGFQKLLDRARSAGPMKSGDYANLFERWGSQIGSTRLSYEWLLGNTSESLDGLVKNLDMLLEVGPGYIEGSTRALLGEQASNEALGLPVKSYLDRAKKSDDDNPFRGKIEKWERSVLGSRPSTAIQRDLETVSPARLARYLAATKRAGGKEPYRDLMLDRVLEAAVKEPELMKLMADPELVQSFRFPTSRRRLALAQLDLALGLESKRATVMKASVPVVEKTDVRKVVKRARELLDRQYPDQTGEKTTVVEAFEQKVATSQAEARYLRDIRINSDNWMKTKDLTKFEIPSVVNHEMRSSMDRLEFFDYVVGRRSQAPSFMDLIEGARQKAYAMSQLESARKAVMTADAAVRSFMLQSFLDDQVGILSEPKIAARLYQNILGDHYKNPVIRELFEGYLAEIPDSEKKVVLSYIYSSFADARGVQRASLKTILEAMGPLGVKAGQFLRTSGRLSHAQQLELEEFFSNALPRHRPGMYADFVRVFGSDLGPVRAVRESVGSGSINYGARADFTLPDGSNRQAIVRFRKEDVSGQIQNENRNWERVADRLSRSQNADVRTLAQTLNEARLAAMDTLKVGGIELDLGYERRMYSLAKKAYEAPAHSVTGLRVEVVKPIDELQRLIPAEYQDSVSIYEYIENQKFRTLSDSQKRAIAQQIVGAELDAMFTRNTFDPDGHIGNWLIDLKGKRLVRIDYAQLRQVDSKEMSRIQGVLNALFIPRPEAQDLVQIARNLETLLDLPSGLLLGEQERIRFLEELTKRSDFPSHMDPHQRLFVIRNELERKLSLPGRPVTIPIRENTRAVVSSLGRLLYFRDFMPERDFFQLFAAHMDLPMSRIIKQQSSPFYVARAAMRSAVAGVRDTCAEMFARMRLIKRSSD